MKADVELAIRREHGAPRPRLVYELSCEEWGINRKTFRSSPLEDQPRVYVERRLADLGRHLKRSRHPPTSRLDRLADWGAELGRRLIPQDLGDLLDELAGEDGEAPTLLLQSEDPYLPWELLKLPRTVAGRTRPGPFLCEAFAVARWLPGRDFHFQLPVERIALMTPGGGEQAQAERASLESLCDVRSVAATEEALRRELARGIAGAWHVAGHAELTADREHVEIPLEDGGFFTPAALSNVDGDGPPALAFLNNCHSGRAEPALSGIGGWAEAFLTAGCGAFIGSLWAIDGGRAACFAEAFYRAFLGGAPIARAVHRARRAIRSEADPTWLAYQLFAHPLARRSRCDERQERPPRRPTAGVEPVGEVEPGIARAAPAVAPSAPPAGMERIHEIDGSVLVYVPGGIYRLGDGDGFEVTLNPFWIGRYPVTREQYQRFLAADPKRAEPPFWRREGFGDPRQPVVGVSWHDARAYCDWAGLALPCEARWEAAARGPERRPYPWGKQPPNAARACYGATTAGPAPVGHHPAGAGLFHLQDLAGNVWEWCADVWDDDFGRVLAAGVDPVGGVGNGERRARRGGSWRSDAGALAASHRSWHWVTTRHPDVGFRCVLPA